MNKTEPGKEIEHSSAARLRSPAAAKACLLTWAEESDARAVKARAGMGSIAAGGAIALLGGMVVSRLFTFNPRNDVASSRDRASGIGLIRWAVLARAGLWLLPRVIRAVEGRATQHASR